MNHIYFCRHGLSELNKAGKWAGSTETPLTPEGRQQAREAGKHAKDLQIDYIICSPLSRAHDTAKIIAQEIGYPLDKIELNSLIIERHFGSMETQPWKPDLDLDGFVDVEHSSGLIERARLTVEHLKTLPALNILVVSHGSFGRALRHALTPDIPFHGSERFENAKIVKLL